MKKIILALVVLVFAAPAWADVVITCAQVGDTNEVVISFDATTETNLVRAFGLDIQLDDDATIIGVGNVNEDYYIHPGTIQITGNEITYIGTPVAEYGDLPSDTLGGLGTSGVTLEMATLYAPTGPGSPNAPPKSGVLLSLYVSRPTAPDLQTCLTITGNVARAGSSGVVMEDPDEDPTVDSSAGCCVVFPSLVCVGDVDGNGATNKPDIIALVNYLANNASAPFWTVPSTNPAYMEAADVDGNGAVNKPDIIALVNYLANNASAPFWTVPCP